MKRAGREQGRGGAKNNERDDAEKKKSQKEKKPQKVIYKFLPASSWSKYSKQIVAIERSLFPKQLQEKPAELRAVFTNPDAVFVTALAAGEVVAFGGGESLWHYVYPEDPEFDSKIEEAGTLYIETIDVKEGWQSCGVGSGLLKALMAEARRRGYRYVAGHWREGASRSLAKKFGGRPRLYEKDYLGSGETYAYVVLKL